MKMADQLARFPACQVEHGDVWYLVGPKGELVPEQTARAALKLQDETTRSLFGAAAGLHDQLLAFKEKAFADVDAYVALLEERHGAKPRGERGNMTLYSFNGLVRVTVQIADRLAFGPEIHVAKQLIIDELVPEWAASSNANLVALVQNAFRVDAEGQLNRYSIIGLRKMEVDDDRWRRAMTAIEESERVLSTSRYIRFYFRRGWGPDGDWLNMPLNLATV